MAAGTFVTVECPSCGDKREVSSRQARRGPTRCPVCRRPPAKVPPVDDTARRYWLNRFSDTDIVEMAQGIWGGRGSIERVRTYRVALVASCNDPDSAIE